MGIGKVWKHDIKKRWKASEQSIITSKIQLISNKLQVCHKLADFRDTKSCVACLSVLLFVCLVFALFLWIVIVCVGPCFMSYLFDMKLEIGITLLEHASSTKLILFTSAFLIVNWYIFLIPSQLLYGSRSQCLSANYSPLSSSAYNISS